MRWLVVGDGSSIHVRRLAAALRDRGVDTHVACFEGEAVPGVGWHGLGSRPASDDRRYLMAVPRLARVIRRIRPDIVNAHYLSSYGLVAALTPSRAVTVQTVWGSDLLVTAAGSRLRRAAAAFALRRAAHATGDSRDLEASARSLAPRVGWHRFIFGPPASLIETDTPRRDTIVSARALIPEMRIPLVVQAFEAARLAGWRLAVVGAGDAPVHGNRVDFYGAVDQSQLHELMLSSKIIVSVPTSDASSASLLEGLAAGLTPVVNDLPANREWVSAGVVSKDPSVAELAHALEEASSRWDPNRSRAVVRDVVWDAEVDRLVRAVQGWRRQ